MITVSFRLKKIKQVVLILLLIGGVFIGYKLWKRPKADVPSPGAQAVTNAPDRSLAPVDYLKFYGWEVGEEATQICEVIIPKEFDETFSSYNELQKQQGTDLTPYQGERVKMMTYAIENYPGTDSDVVANVLVREGEIIGGDVQSTQKDGFIHGFALPGSNGLQSQSLQEPSSTSSQTEESGAESSESSEVAGEGEAFSSHE